jgi:hypothetical protein
MRPKERTAVLGLGIRDSGMASEDPKQSPHRMARKDQAKEPPPTTDHRPPNITKVYSPSFYPQTMTGGSRNPWSYHKVRKKEDVTVERIGRPPHGNKGERRTATAPVMGPTSSDPQSANALIAATDDYAYSYSILPEEGDRDVNANGRHSVHLDGVKN